MLGYVIDPIFALVLLAIRSQLLCVNLSNAESIYELQSTHRELIQS